MATPPAAGSPADASGCIGVTGATGRVGSRLVRHLANAGGFGTVIGLARDPGRLRGVRDAEFRVADYDDPASLRRALAGLTDVVFVASDGDVASMRRHHHNIVEAATTCGVEHVLYTSILDTDDDSPFYYAAVHRETEQLLRSAPMGVTIARTSVFAEFLVDTFVEPARPRGVLELPAGTGHTSVVSREDVAASLAAAAGRRDLDTVQLTGPQAMSMHEVVATVTWSAGRALAYRPIEMSTYRAALTARGTAPWLVEAFASLLDAVAQGRFAATSNDVEMLTGQRPMALGAVLAARYRRQDLPAAQGPP